MRRLILPVLAVIVCLGVGTAAGNPARSRFRVIGYQEQSDPTRLIQADAPGLGLVGVDGTSLIPSGRGILPIGARMLAQDHGAHAAGLPSSLLVSNWSNAINDFSEPLAHRMLTMPASRQRVVSQLTGALVAGHWNGITVDLESLGRRDLNGLTHFMTALRAALGSRYDIDIDVMNATTAAGYVSDGYALSALSHQASHLVLMAYDQHGSWENTPGPVGSLGWTRAGIAAMRSQVPASKIILGVAGYGYAWEPHANVQVSDGRARTLAARAGAPPRFDPQVGEWHVSLPDGTVLWWSDHRSLALHEALAHRLDLAGVAIWDLALSDPLT